MDWLRKIIRKDKAAAEKCFLKLQYLKDYGEELRRPHADYLQDGIYELRISFKRQQYRILYFFYGQNIIIISHGLTKERKIPSGEIEVAVKRKMKLEKDPRKHIVQEIDHV